MLNISKSDKMFVLSIVKRGEVVPKNELYDFILLDLAQDGMISIVDDPFSMQLTYYGFRELEDWDPVLGVSINNQLVQTPYGYA